MLLDLSVVALFMLAFLFFRQGKSAKPAQSKAPMRQKPAFRPNDAVAYARAHAGESIRNFGPGNRARFRAVVVRSLEKGWAVTRLRDVFREQFGLSPDDALNFAQRETSIAQNRGDLARAPRDGVKEKQWLQAGTTKCVRAVA